MPSTIHVLFLTLTLATAHAIPASAADDRPEEAAVPKVHHEIVVTASAAEETVETVPAAVTVITREQIETLAARDLADVLRLVPGVSVARTGSPGKIASLFTRGGSSKQTLVLWNGIELNNPYFSGFDWGRFSTAGVERVEVVRGPFSALYGTDAVSGVVQVLTARDASFLIADLLGGERGLFNGSVSGAGSLGALRFVGSFETRSDEGFAENDEYEQTSGHADVRWSPHEQLAAGVRGRVLVYDVGIPRSVNASGTAFEPRLQRREDGEELEIAIPLTLRAGRGTYDLTVSRLERTDRFEDPEDPFGRTEAVTDVLVQRVSGVARFDLGLHAVSAGVEWEDADVEDRSTYGVALDEARRQAEGIFVEDRFSVRLPVGVLEANAGLRWDHFDTFGGELSPRASLAWIAGPHKVRAGYGRAFRAPAVGELYLPFFGNPALDAERSTSFELGYERAHGRGRVSVTAFRNDFDELIVYDNTTNRFENVGAGIAQGVELGAEHRLGRNVTASLSYTYLDTEDADTGLTFLRRPEHSGSAWLRWSDFGWSASAAVLHTGERADVTDLFPFGRVLAEAVTTIDLVVERDFASGITPYLKVENAADRQYEEVFGYPSPGRRVAVGIRVKVR
ncbi:MAG: TonB-dependent receptor plug domain-containing protein [Thermoanaerobaculia bacterium]